jgi:TonB-dependent SusC/RagA subfamily outer membrane receptor
METLGSYLLQMACWLAGFWLVYAAFLKKETFFELNRWFLLAGLVASLVLPMFPIRYNVVVAASNLSLKVLAVATSGAERVSKLNYWAIAYFLGVALFIIRFAWQSAKLYRLRRQSERIAFGEAQLFKLEKDTAPFSFFNSIYVSKKMCGETELKTVVAHEKVHIDERHWADLLLLEVARALQWFNPLLILYRKAMMQNHEYLADNGTLQKGVSARTYKAVLANQMLGQPVFQVANGFTLFNANKRIVMMNKDKTTPIKRLKLLWALPVMALLMVAFAKPNYVQGESLSQATIADETITVKGKVTDEKGKPLPGTSIIVANTTTGTLSDAQGNYTLTGIKPDTEIVFSFVGYGTKVVKAATKLNVSLSKEVFVIDATNNQIAPPPPPPPPFVLKGDNGKKPLILIDGKVSTVDLNTINPNTIEKVEVLKDQSATAVYGDKGKDGVVLITMKKGTGPIPEPVPPVNTLALSDNSFPTDGKVLIIVDGKITNLSFSQINEKTIESVNILKGKEAIAKYGEKARDAAVEITTKKANLKPESNEVFVVVEEMPQYQGGLEALGSYINAKTSAMNEVGFAEVRFLVDTDGQVKDVKAVSTESDKLNKLATEIISGFPKWTPGMQRGKTVPVLMQIGIDFGSKCITTKHKFLETK